MMARKIDIYGLANSGLNVIFFYICLQKAIQPPASFCNSDYDYKYFSMMFHCSDKRQTLTRT